MKVWLDKKLYEGIIKESEQYLPLETGGMLTGYKDVNGNLVITKLIDAGPKAVRNENSFIPDGKFQQKKLNKVYKETGGVISFLGDWHSHPNSNPYMSELDLKTIKRIAKCKGARTPNPIFIILGTLQWNVKCWRYLKTKKYQVKEIPIDFY